MPGFNLSILSPTGGMKYCGPMTLMGPIASLLLALIGQHWLLIGLELDILWQHLK